MAKKDTSIRARVHEALAHAGAPTEMLHVVDQVFHGPAPARAKKPVKAKAKKPAKCIKRNNSGSDQRVANLADLGRLSCLQICKRMVGSVIAQTQKPFRCGD
jgi:hypothetical protein